MVRFYNTATRKLEEFKSLKKGEVGVYSCGPTVYGNQHLGNLYAYLQWDVLVRFLRSQDLKVKWVVNITDVGHLTGDNLGDADTGEDKMIKGARREKLTVWQVAKKYTNQFLESLDYLNITRPDVLPRATKHIKEQIEIAKKIEAKGWTYKTKTGLVFDTAKFADYSKFARLNLGEQKAGARVKVDPEKKQPWDFFLWVTNKPKQIMKWDSPWGVGFPGWHLECTAMSTKYLGEKFDIHTGGIEHISVHHTNETAQAFGAFGQQTANFWLHNGWLQFKDEKISKSLGNVYLITDLIEKGFDPLAFRYLVLTSHYRAGLNFTWESLKAAGQALNRLRSIVQQLEETKGKRTQLGAQKLKKVDDYQQRFEAALADDLGVPQALAVVWEMVKSNIPSYDKLELVLDFDRVLGLNLAEVKEVKKVKAPMAVKNLADERKILREQGKWEEADKIRQEIEKKGFGTADTDDGYVLKKL